MQDHNARLFAALLDKQMQQVTLLADLIRSKGATTNCEVQLLSALEQWRDRAAPLRQSADTPVLRDICDELERVWAGIKPNGLPR